MDIHIRTLTVVALRHDLLALTLKPGLNSSECPMSECPISCVLDFRVPSWTGRTVFLPARPGASEVHPTTVISRCCVKTAEQMELDFGRRSSVNFGGQDISARKCMKNYINCPNITRCLPEKYFSPEFEGATALPGPLH